MNHPPEPGEESNPWLEIPAGDYEGHMGSPQVGQLQMLNSLFKRVLAETHPAAMVVLGCATGNGFEHFDPAVTRYILGVDINPAYLAITRERYPALEACLDLKCAARRTSQTCIPARVWPSSMKRRRNWMRCRASPPEALIPRPRGGNRIEATRFSRMCRAHSGNDGGASAASGRPARAPAKANSSPRMLEKPERSTASVFAHPSSSRAWRRTALGVRPSGRAR
jgi:hypothetical protein